MIIKGIAASKGIAISKIKIYKKQALSISDKKVKNTTEEINIFEHARNNVIFETESLMSKALDDESNEVYEIMEAHKEILSDYSSFVNPVNEYISKEKINCAYAVFHVLSNMANLFLSLDSEYMRERAADVEDIRDSIIANIQGISSSFTLSEPAIIVAHDMTPSDTAKLDFSLVKGMITEVGGQTCHTAIMARTMGIPAVVSASDILSHVIDEQSIIIDGTEGCVMINATSENFDDYSERINQLDEKQKILRSFIGKKTLTKDSRIITLSANIGIDNDRNIIKNSDAEGIGLVRTEFLFMQRKELPTMNEQLSVYKSIIDTANGKPVTFRTLDAGGDKSLPALNLKSEENPFLGLRAVRISLKFIDLFKQQLKALFIASTFGKLRIMIPMISSCEEIDECMAIISEVRKELDAEKKEYTPDIPIGIMIEVPAAAIMADVLAKKVDFFSIGTNDLIQYTVAVDRGNADIAHLYTPFHPSVLNLIKNTIDRAHLNNIPCSMCGEAAGDTLMIPLLIGLGLRSFSVSPSEILSIRSLISNLSYAKCKTLAEDVLTCSSATEIKSRVTKFMEDKNEE